MKEGWKEAQGKKSNVKINNKHQQTSVCLFVIGFGQSADR